MRQKILTAVVIIHLAASNAFSQQDPQFTQFFYNKLIMNPAYAGSKDAICGTLLYRSQWASMDGAPQTGLFSFDMPVRLTSDGLNYLGLGMTTFIDHIGFERNYSLRIAANYRRDLGFAKLSAGFDVGFTNKGIYGANWITPNTLPWTMDGGIPQPNGMNDFGFDLGLGVYMNHDNWYAGVSTLNLTGSRFNSVNIKQARHTYVMGGYTFRAIGGSNFDLNPNMLIKTDFVTAQVDMNLNVIWREYYWAGITYRLQDAVAINLGMSFAGLSKSRLLEGLQLSYAVDIPTSRLATFGKGGHEIVLRYCFKLFRKSPPPLWDVRHLDSRKDRE